MSVSVEGKLICALIFFIFVSSALNSLFNCSVVLLRIENIETRARQKRIKERNVVLDIVSKSERAMFSRNNQQQRLTSWRPPTCSCSSRNPTNPSSFFRLATNVQNNVRRNNVRERRTSERIYIYIYIKRCMQRYQSHVMYKIHSRFIRTNLGQFLQRGQFYPGGVPSVTTLRHSYRLFILRSFNRRSRFTKTRTELRKFPVTRTMYNTS